MNRLTDKIAFVTGGSRGIGAGIVRRLAAEGADVAFTYTNAATQAACLCCLSRTTTKGHSWRRWEITEMARARWKIAEMNRYGLSSNCTQTAFIYAVRSNRNKNQSESEKAPQKS